MNIFKVLASSKNGILETQTSAILAWLLNPYMDHGLGFTFLRKFLNKIDIEIVNELDKILQPILRSNKISEKIKFGIDLEYNVNQSFIDIIIFMNDYIISIENKINVSSASDPLQLMQQYEGLKQNFEDEYKIRMVFLVPDEISPMVQNEYKTLKTNNTNDNSIIITWDKINEIIQEILNEEINCIIDPIDEYLRHTLKAFSNFIHEDFSGYYFETAKNNTGMNPISEGRKTVKEIAVDIKIKYIGVNYGIIGLLMTNKNELQTKAYQYTSENIKNSNWLEVTFFLEICKYIENSKFESLDWVEKTANSKFHSSLIYYIANHTECSFYIGIQGGEKSLKEMDSNTIKNKFWYLSLTKNSTQWIEKVQYQSIIKERDIFNSEIQGQE